jgi:FkbM family methyltransferase
VSAIVFGIYEYPERVLIERWLPPDLDCVELGCSIGIISRVILNKIHADQKLAAVEASKDLLELSKKNVSDAGFSDRFTPLYGAVHYQGDFVAFSKHEDHIRGTVNHSTIEDGTPTPCVTLSNLLQRTTSGPYSLVMDIEGNEFDLLANDLDSLGMCQAIIAELHGGEASINAFKATLAASDFELVEAKHSVFVFLRQGSLHL